MTLQDIGHYIICIFMMCLLHHYACNNYVRSYGWYKKLFKKLIKMSDDRCYKLHPHETTCTFLLQCHSCIQNFLLWTERDILLSLSYCLTCQHFSIIYNKYISYNILTIIMCFTYNF